jgi:hypothetical protein
MSSRDPDNLADSTFVLGFAACRDIGLRAVDFIHLL